MNSNNSVIKRGPEGFGEVFNGFVEAADIVGETMGPFGRPVTLYSDGSSRISKDGATVAKKIKSIAKSHNNFKNIGFDFVADIAKNADDGGGDGTTGAVALGRELLKNTLAVLRFADRNVHDLVKGMDKGVTEAVNNINSMLTPIKSSDQIKSVATVSANGEKQIGDVIANATEKVGRDGIITVEEGKSLEPLECEVVEGMSFDRGYFSPFFITHASRGVVEFDDPYILITDKKINSATQIVPVLQAVANAGVPLVIIAPDFEGDIATVLYVNKLRCGVKTCLVKAPGFGDRQREMLNDIAVSTGCNLISEDLGLKLDKIDNIEELGRAKKIIVSKDRTIIVGGKCEPADLDSRIAQLRSEIEASSSDYDKEKLQERLARLAGGIAVIKVGGYSEVEVKERADRVRDALNATKAAIEEGVVPGGGCALLRARDMMKNLKGDNEDENDGIAIVKKSLHATMYQIVRNAGKSGEIVEYELKSKHSADNSVIYDVRTGKYVNAYDMGILDPAKIIKTALLDAFGIIKVLVTTNTFVTENTDDNQNKHGPRGGMGDMGMDY